MTTHISEDLYSVQATEDLSAPAIRYRAITLNGTLAQAASIARSAGIMKTGASSGYIASAVVQGITKATVGGAVSTIGWPLTVANSGFLVAAASGNMTVGRALATAASGDMAPVSVDFLNLAYSAI